MAAQTMRCSSVSGGSVEGGGGMRTLECLRGRLLAERVASKAAKEEADQLAKRLDELEKKLGGEVKVRDKAERRLRRAIKRLESLKILDAGLSDCSIGSLSSNSNGRSSGHEVPEEGNNPGSLMTCGGDSVPFGGPPVDGDGGGSAAGSSAGSCALVNSPSQDGSWCSVLSEQSRADICMEIGGEGAGDHDSESRQQVAASDNGSASAVSEEESRSGDGDRLALVLVEVDPQLQLIAGADDGSRTERNRARETELHAGGTHEEEAENNRLAIVLVDPQPQPDSDADADAGAGGAGAAQGHDDVESVLLALRRVKEQLRYTIERRRSELVAHRELYGH